VKLFHRLACSTQAVINDFHQQALLWVHGVYLARLDAEEAGIELCNIAPVIVFQPIGLGGVGGAMVCADWVVEGLDVEA